MKKKKNQEAKLFKIEDVIFTDFVIIYYYILGISDRKNDCIFHSNKYTLPIKESKIFISLCQNVYLIWYQNNIQYTI